MQIIDLSHPITDGMSVYPGDPEVRIGPALTVADDGVTVSLLELGTHTGTHLDAPCHVIPGGRTVDRIPLRRLVGPARILRADPAPGCLIEVGDIVDGIPAELPGIVCVATGWDRHFGAPDAPARPVISRSLAEELWRRGARTLGVDTCSPDGEDALPVHDLWLGGDGVIVENLARLTDLPPEVEVVFAPLRIAGGDGAPIRAFAVHE